MQITFGALMAGFALSRTPVLSYVLLALAGAALMVVFAIFMTLVQSNVEDRLRGRVVSVYSLAFRGAIPLGNLAAGRARQGVLGAGGARRKRDPARGARADGPVSRPRGGDLALRPC